MSTAKNKAVGSLGTINLILGVFLIIAGIVAYAAVGAFLKDENITVPADAKAFAGKQVAGPLTAFSQADIINTHAMKSDNPELAGKTYAELGSVASKAKADAKAAANDESLNALIDAGDIEGLTTAGASDEVIELAQLGADASKQRTTVMNGSFLRASLFTSVVAFGVSLLVVGIGVITVVNGVAIRKLAAADVAEAKKEKVELDA